MIALFWRRLPEVARRRMPARAFPRFATRLLVFFVTFFLCFGAYVMAFVTGSEWGVEYGKACLSFSEWLGGQMERLLSHVSIPIVQRIGDGLVRLMSNSVAAVIVSGFVAAGCVVALVCAVHALSVVIAMFMGRDGSQAELFEDDGTEDAQAGGPGRGDGRGGGLDGTDDDARDDGDDKLGGGGPGRLRAARGGVWRSDGSRNPYSAKSRRG